MRILSFLFLLTFIACGNDHKKKSISGGIPYVPVSDSGTPSLIVPGNDETVGGVTTGGTTTGEVSNTTGGTTTGEISNTTGGTTTGEVSNTTGGTTTGEVSNTTGGSTTGEVSNTTGGSTTGEVSNTTGGTTTGDNDVISIDATAIKCDFSKDQEKETVLLKIYQEGSNRYAVLSNDNDHGKVTFGGFVLSPSGNENAAVQAVDKNFTIEEGKVIKITARILFNTHTGEGELQLAYSYKGPKGKIAQTAYETLADINHCSEI